MHRALACFIVCSIYTKIFLVSSMSDSRSVSGLIDLSLFYIYLTYRSLSSTGAYTFNSLSTIALPYPSLELWIKSAIALNISTFNIIGSAKQYKIARSKRAAWTPKIMSPTSSLNPSPDRDSKDYAPCSVWSHGGMLVEGEC
jgi:hypothetical protein